MEYEGLEGVLCGLGDWVGEGCADDGDEFCGLAVGEEGVGCLGVVGL